MKEEINKNGFTIIPNIFSEIEISSIAKAIDSCKSGSQDFRQSKDLFAIRRFFQAVPEAGKLVWNRNLVRIVKELCGDGYFIVKSIYFDKPSLSNWFVAWHQDLTISVDRKINLPGFIHWTEKQGVIAVEPPVSILERIYTIRIHLDDCDESNGALRVVPGSHTQGVLRPEMLLSPQETLCEVKAGGVMLMRPLLMHSSKRSTSERQRRVIHIEISNLELPDELKWAERGTELG